MKIIDESKGINKSTKESLKSQILNRLLSIDGVSEDDILITWDSHRDTRFTLSVLGKIYCGKMLKCGRIDDTRRPRVKIKDTYVVRLADGLMCKSDLDTNKIYLCDNFGREIFEVTGLTPIGDVGLPDSSYMDKTTTLYNDDVNNILFNQAFSLDEIVREVERASKRKFR